MKNWYQLETQDVLQQLGSNVSFGLSTQSAHHRLEKYGFNELIESRLKNPWQILWDQLSETLVIILLVAAIFAHLLGDYRNTVGIIAIVVVIVSLGFSQEYQVQKTTVRLKNLAVPMVKVRRDGDIQEISARELVPGDILLLETENIVPADCRLLSSRGLRVQESALTGISQPANKDPQVLVEKNTPLLHRYKNMVYMGTVVTYGHGEAVVTETGMNSELGRITKMIQRVEPKATLLQKRLDNLGHGLIVITLAVVVFIVILELFQGENARLIFLTAVTLIVAALPEGLPAVVTVALAFGAQKMLERRALILNLSAVETLGLVTAICSGKTGTLTANRMTVSVVDVAGHRLDLNTQLPEVSSKTKPARLLTNSTPLALILASCTLCNDAQIELEDDSPEKFYAVGDPTEAAFVFAAASGGLWKSELEQPLPRILEIPYDSRRQRMTTVHRFPRDFDRVPYALSAVGDWSRSIMDEVACVAFTKGKVNSLMSICNYIWVDSGAMQLDGNWRDRIMLSHQQLVQSGLRVLSVAFRPLSSYPSDGCSDLEQDFIFIGLVGLTDPARPEARDAIAICKGAGIRPIMVTGDRQLSAWHLANEVGIATNNQILTGKDIYQLPIEQLKESLQEVSVYARFSPEHKQEIVRLLQRQGQIVAMTGDGMNDAPALKVADIGIAMGIIGTDVAKNAADMVLLDDNFDTIVAAVKEGRVIYDNIRKFIKYILSSNAGELWVMLLAPLTGMPLPLLPLQILWINLTTDGLPALALALEPAERNIMNRLPYPPNESFFARGMGRDIIWIGLLMGVVSFSTGYIYWRMGDNSWQTILFTTITLSQMGNALATRSERDSVFKIGLFSNKHLLAAVVLTLCLQLAVIYTPFLQQIFTTQALSLEDLLICLILSSVVFWAVELEKWLVRRKIISF